ncbi:MAG: EF-P beta-lysylation protein EpmB [Acidobacteriota bacterium]
MIPRSVPTPSTPLDTPSTATPRVVPAWQRALAKGPSQLGELLDRLGLDATRMDADVAAHRAFRLRVPESYVARMRPGDPDDPLLRQVLPIGAEMKTVPGFDHDPLAEAAMSPVPGLLHKYHGRVLLTVTGACAIHCRYCFRRHFPYDEHVRDLGPALAYIAARSDIEEVIWSGGDPLSVRDDRLAALADEVAAIPHVERLRIHTRLPIVLPERVDDALLAWLGQTRLRPVMVVHANHPREIDDAVVAACERLTASGVVMLNQAVLLAGVNDDAEVLVALSRALDRARVLPYYLHLLDRVAGAAHFDVEIGRADRLHDSLRERLPGYLVPRLVREVPGATAKTPVITGASIDARTA